MTSLGFASLRALRACGPRPPETGAVPGAALDELVGKVKELDMEQVHKEIQAQQEQAQQEQAQQAKS